MSCLPKTITETEVLKVEQWPGKQVAISLCKIVAFLYQKLVLGSGPGALQIFLSTDDLSNLFSIQIPAISRHFRYYVFYCLSNLLDPFCFRVPAPFFFLQTFPKTTRFINVGERIGIDLCPLRHSVVLWFVNIRLAFKYFSKSGVYTSRICIKFLVKLPSFF